MILLDFQDIAMRLTCPVCESPMKALSRPPELKHNDNHKSYLSVNYCVCIECGRRAKATHNVEIINDFPVGVIDYAVAARAKSKKPKEQTDWVEEVA